LVAVVVVAGVALYDFLVSKKQGMVPDRTARVFFESPTSCLVEEEEWDARSKRLDPGYLSEEDRDLSDVEMKGEPVYIALTCCHN
jgi:hypothetical protein